MLDSRLRPNKVYFEVTNICNFKCDFCPINSSEREKGFMDFELYKKGIKDIIENNITDTVCFHILGEPMIYPQIVQALRYAKQNGLKTDLTTNGSLLTSDRVKTIMDENLIDKLNISVETIDENEHECRGSQISFEEYYKKILDAVSYLKQSSSKTNIELCLMNTYTKRFFDIDKNIRMNFKSGVFRSKLTSFISDLYKVMGKDLSSDGAIKELKRMNLNYPRLLRIDDRVTIFIQPMADWGNAFTSRKVLPAKIGTCGYAFTNIGILRSGEVTMCCVDYDGNTSLGNIKTQSLSDILSSERVMEIRDGYSKMRVTHEYCQRCLGSTNPIKLFVKGLIGIYLFKIIKFHPGSVREVNLS